MRGPLRWAQNSRRGPLTLARGACHRAGHFGPDPLAHSTSPRAAGRGEMQSRSRDACAPELCQRHSQNRPAEQDRVTPKPAVGPAFGSIMLCEHVARVERQRNPGTNVRLDAAPGVSTSFNPGYKLQTKRKRNAGRRISPNLRALRARLARSVARSPDGVPPRRLLQRPNATAQLQNALPGTGLNSGRYPPLPVPVQRLVADRSSCRPGVFPEPPGSGGDEPPPAGTALAPPAGVAG